MGGGGRETSTLSSEILTFVSQIETRASTENLGFQFMGSNRKLEDADTDVDISNHFVGHSKKVAM